jgi:hypothetical protein
MKRSFHAIEIHFLLLIPMRFFFLESELKTGFLALVSYPLCNLTTPKNHSRRNSNQELARLNYEVGKPINLPKSCIKYM